MAGTGGLHNLQVSITAEKRKEQVMNLMDYAKNAAGSCTLFRSIQTEAEDVQSKAVSDISISYHDMGQISRRVDKLQGEIRKAGQCIDELTGVLAEKRDIRSSGNGNSVQLEREIASVAQKLQELEKRKADMETAAVCCGSYGIFGLDYSVSAGRLYYKGKTVRYFSDPDSSGDGRIDVYEDPQGEVSVMAKRGSTGHVLYVKVYDY